jgi:hypothetical protein
MTGQLELPLGNRGETPTGKRSEEAPTAAHGDERSGASDLMEKACERQNLLAALKRVRKNKGSPGIDGMTVDELPGFLREHWPRLREQLLDGTYQPAAVKQQLIPKASGGMRKLGIPTVVDRFIQQALLQVLQPMLDPCFSKHSHGFRPGHRAHDAIVEAQRYIQEGRRWVVDVDLEQFFDRVNHDVLMGRLAKRIGDRRLLRLIRRYLEAGIMANGLATERHEGTPQGGPNTPPTQWNNLATGRLLSLAIGAGVPTFRVGDGRHAVDHGGTFFADLDAGDERSDYLAALLPV